MGKKRRKEKVNKRGRRDVQEILRKVQPEGGEIQAKEMKAWGVRVKKKKQGAKSLGHLWEVNGVIAQGMGCRLNQKCRFVGEPRI